MFSPEPILKDHGIVLRWYPVTDTSRIVIWFTEHHGRVATIVRGSQRPKSWVLGQYDLFYTCEVLFYAKAKEDLHALRECYPLETRSAFRQDWQACAGASFVCDVLGKITPSREAAPLLYHQATKVLDLLAENGHSSALLLWFELQVLRDLGVAPDLSASGGGPFLFDVPAGVLRSGVPASSEVQPLSPGALTCFRELLDQQDPGRVRRLKLLPAQVRELSDHLQRFTQWHLDLDLRSRHHALTAETPLAVSA